MFSLFEVPLADAQPSSFTRLIERLLQHLGFHGVSNVDGQGDGGADLVACTSDGEKWVFQAKTKRHGVIGSDAVEELFRGMQVFGATRGAVVTNREFSTEATARIERHNELIQRPHATQLWDREVLEKIWNAKDFKERVGNPDLRAYQLDAFEALQADLTHSGTALLEFATGLGKTVVAGSIIDRFLQDNPDAQVLVLAHTKALVAQLEQAIWHHVPRYVPVQRLSGGERPGATGLPGITVATVQSAINYIREGFRPDFIFIDEAHHVGPDPASQYRVVLDLCDQAWKLGVTATPWRADRFDIADVFGEPLADAKVSIEKGMRLGFLVDVDYRLLCDNINWEFVRERSENNYSLADLNRRLFLPQLDESIRDELITTWQDTPNPRGIVFCQNIEHAERILATLRGFPDWNTAEVIHNRLTTREQQTALAKFRLGDIRLLVSVDMLNEGVDIPDVNIVCFARVTHSRRIFIQQLGRGLRLSEGKTKVTVLDFVSDLRRAKAVLDLRARVTRTDMEEVWLDSSHRITFSDGGSESLLNEWLLDAADLDTKADDYELQLPPSGPVSPSPDSEGLSQDMPGHSPRAETEESMEHELSPEKHREKLEVSGWYSREEVGEMFLPETGRPKGGSWDTGYVKVGNDLIIFMNIDVPGRTGHDFPNQYDETNHKITWFGKPGTNAEQPLMRDLIEGEITAHCFARWDNTKPEFQYLGIGRYIEHEDGIPTRASTGEPKETIKFLLGCEDSAEDLTSGDPLGAMVCAYYLSRFDESAYDFLGYGNQTETHEGLGQVLGIKATTVKNYRDEFDVAHPHRKGWRNREPRRVIKEILDVLSLKGEAELRDLALSIISDPQNDAVITDLLDSG